MLMLRYMSMVCTTKNGVKLAAHELLAGEIVEIINNKELDVVIEVTLFIIKQWTAVSGNGLSAAMIKSAARGLLYLAGPVFKGLGLDKDRQEKVWIKSAKKS